MRRIDDCQILALPQILREQGNLTILEGATEPLGFEIARMFYLYDIPGGAARGGHAHHQCKQFIVCVMGAFRVALDDGAYQRVVTLDRAYYGLYVPPLIWAELRDFSAGAICLVVASAPFAEEDYIRRYDDFVAVTRP